MKRNYERMIDTLLGVMFACLLFGFAKSICFLDYQKAYFDPTNASFAKVLFENDAYLIAFGAISIFLCILYALMDFFIWKHSRFVQFIIGLLLLGISAYLFILLCGLRNLAFNTDNSLAAISFSLYKEYRSFSLEIIVSQFLISLHSLLRSFFTYFHSYQKADEK